MRRLFLSVIAAALLALAAGALVATAQHGWPIDPQNSDHPIGNSFGEFQDFGGVYMHTGIDILANPYTNASGTVQAGAPWVRVTVTGTVTGKVDGASTFYTQYGATISGTDGVTYRYWHLAGGSYAPDFVNDYNNGDPVHPGDAVARLVHWTCSYHHLHYDLISGGNYLDPLAGITPKPDSDLPQISAVRLAQNNSNPWSAFNPAAEGACTVVSGNVDVVVQARDEDNAGSALAGADTLWVRNLRWRACPESSPACPWQNTWTFANMPTGWGNDVMNNAATQAYYSNRAPWDSDSNYCAATWLYGVVTNFSGGTPNTAGTWATAGLPNGSYAVSVEATDFAGNVRTAAVHACVQNTGGCTTELTIRDANDDTGAIPYPGGNWWVSPDITANPGTADEDVNINLGAANPIQVRVRNTGSCPLPAGAAYNVCLGWAPPSGSVAYPLPAANQIGCQAETVPAGGLAPGASRTTAFSWTPSAADVPNGHQCLIAWVDMPGDAVQNTPAVNWDDNRAQQNITFKAPPGPAAPAATAFWVNPQKMIGRRSLEMTFEWSGDLPMLRDLRLLIGPELSFGKVTGGEIVDRTADGGWVVGAIDPAGRLRLEDLRLEEPARLELQAVGDPEVKTEGQFFAAHVVEYGRLMGQDEIAPVGGLTLRFQPGVRQGGAQVRLGCRPFEDWRAAKAVLVGVPWAEIVQRLGDPAPALALLDCRGGMIEADAAAAPYDLDGAAMLLAEAGIQPGLPVIVLVREGDDALQDAAFVLAELLAALGLPGEVALAPAGDLEAKWAAMMAADEVALMLAR